MPIRFVAPIAVAFALAACVTTPATPPTPSTGSSSDQGEFAPTPYTAAQSRDATKPGRTYEWRAEELGKPPIRIRMVFTRVSAADAEFQRQILDEQATPLGEPQLKQVSWEALRKHAEFARAATTITEERVTTPAGTFDCLVYSVVEKPAEPDAGEVVTRYHFARSLPGAPVLFWTEVGGQRVMTSTLVRYEPGE